jgi:hypothetical protein
VHSNKSFISLVEKKANDFIHVAKFLKNTSLDSSISKPLAKVECGKARKKAEIWHFIFAVVH